MTVHHPSNDFHFSRRSETHLATLNPALVKVARLALRRSRVDFTIISSRRDRIEQRRLVALGKSQTMDSRHLKGRRWISSPLTLKPAKADLTAL